MYGTEPHNYNYEILITFNTIQQRKCTYPDITKECKHIAKDKYKIDQESLNPLIL